jgi:hypothetical protein
VEPLPPASLVVKGRCLENIEEQFFLLRSCQCAKRRASITITHARFPVCFAEYGALDRDLRSRRSSAPILYGENDTKKPAES